MKAYWSKSKKNILNAIVLDDNPESLIALELRQLNDGMSYERSIVKAKLMIQTVRREYLKKVKQGEKRINNILGK
jgi:hypothetical protein